MGEWRVEEKRNGGSRCDLDGNSRRQKKAQDPNRNGGNIPPGQARSCSGLWLTGALKWELDMDVRDKRCGADASVRR